MNDSHLASIAQIKEFVKVARDIEFRGARQKEKYDWLNNVLLRFRYCTLRKKDKSILRTYMMKMTSYSHSQLSRLIAQKKVTGRIVARTANKHCFPKRYQPEDVARLIETDQSHDRLSGPATRRIFERMYEIFNDSRFGRLKDISPAHIYNLRATRQYLSRVRFFAKTKPTAVNIGERKKPNPEGRPGYLRVDTVHQGDKDKEKGVYHINLVDEVTQWEIVVAVEKISEHYLRPVLAAALGQFPFYIKGFHSDNGSEYINKIVAALLNKLLIEQTKSRARHCNDNALVEGKNGSIIRKHMGYGHIAQRQAAPINEFYQHHFNPYLNYHRPCGFATVKVDFRGKEKKVYDVYRTPFEALKAQINGSDFLKTNVTLEQLEKIAHEQSDNECAAKMQKAKQKLFSAISAASTIRSGSIADRKNLFINILDSRRPANIISGSSLD